MLPCCKNGISIFYGGDIRANILEPPMVHSERLESGKYLIFVARLQFRRAFFDSGLSKYESSTGPEGKPPGIRTNGQTLPTMCLPVTSRSRQQQPD
jgi:hypothetical protein